jgi:hypothetical protein
MNRQTLIEDVEARADACFDRPVATRHQDPRQRFTVCSIVAPEGTSQKSKEMMIRFYGCTETLEEANAWAKRIRDSNNFFDVYVSENWSWVPLPPCIDKIENVQCTDQRIQQIRDSYISHLKGEKRDMIERLEDVDRQRKAKEQGKKAFLKERRQYFHKGGAPKIPLNQIPEKYHTKKFDGIELGADEGEEEEEEPAVVDVTDEGAEESKQ